MRKIKAGDIIFLLLIAAASVFLIRLNKVNGGDTVHVDADGTKYEFSLSKDGTYKIPGPLGDTEILIENQKVRIVDSPCPGKNCIRQGAGTTLVCLPNKITVTVQSQGGLDAVAQ